MLNPTRIRTSAVIHCDRGSVWALLTDRDAWITMLPATARIDLVTARIDQVGSRWKTINGQGDNAVEVLNEVVELIPQQSHVVRSTWAKATNTVRTTLEPSSDGTLVSVETDIHWEPGLRTLVDRLSAAMTASQSSQRAIEKFKVYAEGVDGR